MEKLNQIIVFVGALLIAGFVTLSIFAGGGNEIGNFATYLPIVCGVAALLNARAGIIILFFLAAYSDLIKRMLVFGGGFSGMDITYILATAPITVACCAISVLFGQALGRHKADRIDLGIWIGVVVLFIVLSLKVALSGVTVMSSLQSIANSVSYLFVIPLMRPLYRSADAFRKLMVWMVIIFLPVAGYGIYQGVFGLTRFEISYLESGYTITALALFEERPRPFSTLNGPQALAMMSAIMCCVSILLACGTSHGGKRISGRAIYFIAALIYFVAVVSTTVRSGLVFPPIVILLWLMFTKRWMTLSLYAFSAVVFAVLVFSSSWLLRNLDEIQSAIGYHRTPWIARMTNVLTYSDRLRGFENLKDGNLFTPFGAGISEEGRIRHVNFRDDLYTHDALTGLLVKYGVIPTLLFGIVSIAILAKVHKKVWSTKSGMAAFCVSMDVSLVIVSILSGSQVHVFPINCFFWLFAGFQVSLLADEYTEERLAAAVRKGRETEGALSRRAFARA